jgi:hypothetical protein
MNIQALNRQNPADVGARPAYEANPPMPPEANPCILPAILDKFGHLAARLSAGTEILKENGERAGRSRRRKYTVEDLVQR